MQNGTLHTEASTSDVAFSQRQSSLQAPMVVNEIADGCLYSGFFGRLDSARVKAVTDRILSAVERSDCEAIIVDMSNIDVIDSVVAGHIFRIKDTLMLVGVRTILCGISPVVAQTMVATGLSASGIDVSRNLKGALVQYTKSLPGGSE